MSTPQDEHKDSNHGHVSRRTLLGATGALLAGGVVAIRDDSVAQAMSPPSLMPQASEQEALKQAKAAVKSAEKAILKISREVWNKPAVGLDLGELREVSARCQKGTSDEYVSGVDAN